MPSIKSEKPAKPKSKAGKAVSIWASPKDRAAYKRVCKKSGKALSEIVRVLVAGYEKGTLKPDSLPTIAKKPKKAAAAVAEAV